MTIFPHAILLHRAKTPSYVLNIFGHVTVTGFNICYSVPNFIKIGQFFYLYMAI